MVAPQKTNLRISRLFADSGFFIKLQFGVLVLSLLPALACADVELQQIRDLREEAALVQQQQLPLLVLFSTDYCEVCAAIKTHVLKPMLKNDDYDNKVIVRELPVNDYHTLIDFDGERIGGDRVSMRYKVDLIPTVILMDHRGRPLAPPLVGMVSQHHYDQALDQRIDLALQRLRGAE